MADTDIDLSEGLGIASTALGALGDILGVVSVATAEEGPALPSPAPAPAAPSASPSPAPASAPAVSLPGLGWLRPAEGSTDTDGATSSPAPASAPAEGESGSWIGTAVALGGPVLVGGLYALLGL